MHSLAADRVQHIAVLLLQGGDMFFLFAVSVCSKGFEAFVFGSGFCLFGGKIWRIVFALEKMSVILPLSREAFGFVADG